MFSEYDYAMQDVRLKLDQPIEQCRLFMVFDGRWKYIHASGFRPMLYDLETDPQELTDRGDDPACAERDRATAGGAVRLGAASQGTHHHQHREDRGLREEPAAGEARRS